MTLDEYVTARAAEETAKRPQTSRRGRATNERGLVILPPIEVFGDGFRLVGGGIDPQELRLALLFWDKLDYPSNNLIEIAPGPDADFLIDVGGMKRTHVAMGGSYSGGDVVRAPLIRAFQLLDEAEPGTWSIATGERSISFVDDELREGRGALVTLHRAIPVPDKDVPLAEVWISNRSAARSCWPYGIISRAFIAGSRMLRMERWR